MIEESKSQEDHAAYRHLLSGWRFKTLLLTTLISVISYFLFTLWVGWDKVLESVVKIGVSGIALALSLSLLNFTLRYMRWRFFLKHLGHTIPWKKGAQIYLSGFALTITPGKSGEAIRGVFLKDYHIPFRKSFGIFFAERISDLIAVGVLAMSGLWIHPEIRPILLVVAACMIFFFYMLQKEHWLKAIAAKMEQVLPHRIARHTHYLLEIALALRTCFIAQSDRSSKISSLLSTFILGVIAWGAEAVALYALLNILGHGMPLLTALFVYGFSLVIGGITLLPGGLGGAEVAMLEMLKLQGINLANAVAVTLVIRLTTLWFSVFLGLLAFPKNKVIWHQ